MKRRILEDLKITEISGVDRPCQEGAIVTLMKRAPDSSKTGELSARIAKLKKQLDLLKKYNPDQKRADDGKWTDGGGSTKKPGAIARGAKAALTAYRGVKRVGGKILRTAWDIDSMLGHVPSIALAGTLGRAVWTGKSPTKNQFIRDLRDVTVAGRPADRYDDSVPKHRRSFGPILTAEEIRARGAYKPASGTTASVPFMITTSMKQELLDRNLTTREKLKTLTPAQAHALLAKNFGVAVDAFKAAARIKREYK